MSLFEAPSWDSCATIGCGLNKSAGEYFCLSCLEENKLQEEIMEEHGKPKLGGKRIDIVKGPTETFQNHHCDHCFRTTLWKEGHCCECGRKDGVAEKADRFDDNKPMLQYNLLGREVCELEASVWAAGAEKYSPGNWLKGQSTTKAAGSLLRHLTAYLAGEDDDPESGLPHLGHVITCAKILANGQLKGFDDRGEG